MAIGKKLFRIGAKQVFLPSDTIAMTRPKANLPPNMASFKVPLTFNKLDLRDYLLHAYNVETTAIRSHVVQVPITQHEVTGRIYRPRPLKYMIAELAKPFVWPEQPEDKGPWNHPEQMRQLMRERREKSEAKQMERLKPKANAPVRDDSKMDHADAWMRQEAQRLLAEGGWENKRRLGPKFGESKEVEEVEEVEGEGKAVQEVGKDGRN